MDLGVFRRSSSTTSKPVVRCDLAFDDTTESSREPSVSPPRDRRRSRFARLRPGAIRSTAAPRDSTKPASHEVLHPSGDFIVEVRITWVCLTQHLPPLGFLNPSTDFSFHDLSALFQTDATYGVQRTGADLRATSASVAGHGPKAAPRAIAEHSERRRQPKSTATERRAARTVDALSRRNPLSGGHRRRVTHLVPCEQSPREEGATTSCPNSSPPERERSVSVTERLTTLRPETRRDNQVRKPNCSATPVTPASADQLALD